VRSFLLYILLQLFVSSTIFAQSEKNNNFSIEVSYLNGNILEHNPDIGALINQRNNSVFVKYNRKTTNETWAQYYNRPDWGFSGLYQDLGNEVLGKNIAAYGHYNFHFLKRNLELSVGTGIAYNTNPYDPETNFRNVAYGSHLMSTTFFGLSYKRPRILANWGLETGIHLFHFSNGRLRTPNTSTNVLGFSLGLNYDPIESNFDPLAKPAAFSEPIRFNAQLLGGANENSVIGNGRHPFLGVQFFVDKRFSYKSSVQFGAELFASQAMRDYIEYRAAAFPEDGLNGDEDSNRIGIFAGYELRVSEVAIFVHLGYYIYYPVDFEGRIYDRLGIKRYIGKHFYGSVAVKAHAAKAEALEFGIGYRL